MSPGNGERIRSQIAVLTAIVQGIYVTGEKERAMEAFYYALETPREDEIVKYWEARRLCRPLAQAQAMSGEKDRIAHALETVQIIEEFGDWSYEVPDAIEIIARELRKAEDIVNKYELFRRMFRGNEETLLRPFKTKCICSMISELQDAKDIADKSSLLRQMIARNATATAR